MKQIDATACKTLRTAIERALQQVAETHELIIEVGSMNYNHDHVNVKVECRLANANSQVEKDYEIFKLLHDLPELGTDIIHDREQYKVVGCKPKSPKYPILVENGKGDTYKISMSALKQAKVLA